MYKFLYDYGKSLLEVAHMTFGEMLVILIDRSGITQTELAERCGMSKQAITELIKGRAKEPSFSKAVAMAEVLDVSLSEMVDMLRGK